MDVKNAGNQTIKIKASYEEIASLVSVLDEYWKTNNDDRIKQLAYELHNPKVKNN